MRQGKDGPCRQPLAHGRSCALHGHLANRVLMCAHALHDSTTEHHRHTTRDKIMRHNHNYDPCRQARRGAQSRPTVAPLWWCALWWLSSSGGRRLRASRPLDPSR